MGLPDRGERKGAVMAKRPVKLSEIVTEMESQSDEGSSYLNSKTGKLEWVPEELIQAADSDEPLEDDGDWGPEEIEVAKQVIQGDPAFIALPDRFEIDEWRMMERFTLSVDDPQASDALDRAIHGRGAFRCFKDTVHLLGLADQWYRFRDEQYKQIAVDWCEEHELEYEDDLRSDAQ